MKCKRGLMYENNCVVCQNYQLFYSCCFIVIFPHVQGTFNRVERGLFGILG